ncbi:uncharacterized protein LOC132630834 [Lycium barbarum]|uniref:uncharacterized protein LOC132630834 n=1 Tax=Lycium barbarum TaxID=112863 RepID=UPI00293E8779|nr:uncharacterized protein LOC132630834 [Lycium barbarum]
MFRASVIYSGGHWDKFVLLAEFTYNNSYHLSIDMVLFEDLYNRRCRSPIGWFDAFEVRPWGTDMLKKSLDCVKLIQEKYFRAQSRQMEYVEWKVRHLEFMVSDQVLRRIGEVAYEVGLPTSLSSVHLVVHVSMLKKYHSDDSYIIHWDSVLFDQNLFFEEEPVAILDRQVRKLRSKEIALFKVQ